MREVTARRPVRFHILFVLLAAASLVGGCAGPTPSASPGVPEAPATGGPLASASASPSPGATPGPTPGPTPTARPDGWSPLALPDLPQIAALEPVTSGTSAVAADTDFRLRSLDGRPPAELAAHLVAEPALAFEVVSVQGDTAIVRPTSQLAPRTTYRISLARSDGSTEAAWTARAAGPLRVTDTVPGDASTAVPRETGIEVTFDQYGVSLADFARHFSIRPAVNGRFEAAGRTIAFVPEAPLAKGRLYTVVVRAGLPLAGTGEELAEDVVVRFETAAKVPSRISAVFPGSLYETSTTTKAVVSIAFSVPENRSAPRSVDITVHRVDGLAAAVVAWRAIVAAPEWTLVSTTEPVPTADLDRVFSGSVRTKSLDDDTTWWFTVPVRLPAGWYVVTERWAGIPRQALLQVSDIATFAMVSTDRTAVWTNSLRTGGVIEGAAVTLAGKELGRTDGRGLLLAPTPAALLDGSAADTILVVRHEGQTAFRPVGSSGSCEGCDGDDFAIGEGGYDTGYGWADDEWWRLLFTDREIYRTTDTVNAWGMAHNRDTGELPGSVRLELRVQGDGDEGALPPIVAATAQPDRNGAYAASLALRDVPDGYYVLNLVVDGEPIGETWLEVGTITKPAWQLSLDTRPHAVIAGSRVAITATAQFFEGTPVAGTRLLLTDWDETELGLRTDAEGLATATIRIPRGYCGGEQTCTDGFEASPTLPEEAEIHAGTEVMVFAASAVVDTEAEVSGTRLRIAGTVSDVVLSRYERPGVDPWEVDPRGKGRPGASVSLSVVESWVVERKVGTRYDFITKRVVPVYETEDRSRTVATRTVRTDGDGRFGLRIDVRGGRRSYEVTASYVDEAGRRAQTTAWADEAGEAGDEDEGWYVTTLVDATTGEESGAYSVGDAVRVRLRGEVRDPDVERYLYAIHQRGLRYVTVGTTPTFRTTFEASSLPAVRITGVRFNGHGYEAAVSDFEAQADLDDRQLTVKVIPDRARYAPGDTASVTVRTLGSNGSPVPASVYVTAVDEKLYAIGAAYDHDPLSALYESLGDGLLAVAISHGPPAGYGEGGQDTMGGDGGGDERTDFRDSLVATLVVTDARGAATVRVPLADDLTSWHVSASAVDDALRAGSGTGRLEVGLPFFAEATIAAEYLAADRPIIRVRGFGSDLSADDRVTFSVSSDSLPMSPVRVTAKAFKAAEVPLPALSVGTHRVRIEAAAGGRRDTLVRTFRVIDSRASRLSTTWSPLDGATRVEAGAGSTFTRLTLVDAGRGRVIPTLYDLAWSGGARADQVLASALAGRVLAEAFVLETDVPLNDDGLGPFWREHGLALVAHGSAQLEVTALAAMANDPRLDDDHLRTSLERVANDERARRDRRLLALAGLAGLGEPVLREVRAASARDDLSVAEQVTLALAALFAGDEALAGRLERDVLRAHGVAYGPWLRIDTGDPEGDAVLTARLAIVAASLGDPTATPMDTWLADNPPATTVVDLERALAARGWADRVAGGTAVAALTVGGSRREVTVRAGEPVSLDLTRDQAATARLEPVSGSVLVVTSREVPLDAAGLTQPKGVTMTRAVKPAGRIGATDTVVVTLRVTLGKAARPEAWRVVEWAPSGLAAILGPAYFEDEDEEPASERKRTVPPDWVDGQRVEFNFGGNPKTGVWTLRYVARVVTPGTYRWEPAVLQSSIAPDQGIVVARTKVTIEGSTR